MCLEGWKPLWPIPHKDRRAPDTEMAPCGCGPDTCRPEGKSREGSWGCTEGPASAHWAMSRRALLLRPGAHGAATPLSAQLDAQLASRRAAVNSTSLSLRPSVHPCALTSAAPPGGAMGVTGSRTTPPPEGASHSGPSSNSAIHSVVCGLWCISDFY